MKAKEKDETIDPASGESYRLMELLHTLARMMGVSNAALARRADVSLASLVRYFKGEAEPRLDFVLAVVPAIGLSVKEFFELAYPEPTAPSVARQKLKQMFGPIRAAKTQGPEPEPGPEAPLQREELEKILDDFRADLLREMRKILKGGKSA